MADQAKTSGLGCLLLIGCGLVLLVLVSSQIYLNFLAPAAVVSYRYRLSIAVEADSRVHTGSSVIQVTTTLFTKSEAGIANGFQSADTIKGQAVFIDLGNRGALIAALSGENYDYSTEPADALAGRAILRYSPHNVQGYPITLENLRTISQARGQFDLTAENMPAFFWFPEPGNLATAKEVKPQDFASVIGDATRLVSAHVEITQDNIVVDIDKKLPACALLRGPPNNGNNYTTPGGLILGCGQFVSNGNE